MKKFNITSKAQAVISFTIIQVLCAFIAAYCALHDDSYQNAILTFMFLWIVTFCEWVKYKITHPNDITQD